MRFARGLRRRAALWLPIGLGAGAFLSALSIHHRRLGDLPLGRLVAETVARDLNRSAAATLAILILWTLIRPPGAQATVRGWAPLAAVLLTLAGTNLAARAWRPLPPRPWNVLLISVDTLRADHLGSYGYRRPTSPALDRLADQGTLFLQAGVQRPKTSPSFASMLTGTSPHVNGVRKVMRRVPTRFHLLAERLRNLGYRTAAIVSNPNLGTAFRFDAGFDLYVRTWLEPEDEATPSSVEISLQAVEWLREHGREAPFHLWLHYMDPHAPYAPPPPYDGMFVGDDLFDGDAIVPIGADDLELGAIPPISQLPSADSPQRIEERRDFYIAQYDAEIRHVDAQIARVLDEIDASGLSASTLVVFTSDHGESLGEHEYYFEHGMFPYEGTLRVPLILRLPGEVPAGLRIERPVALLDLVPTVLDLVGSRPSPRDEGSSLAPLLSGSDPAPSAVFAESGYADEVQGIVREGRWKLVHIPSQWDRDRMSGARFELYDLVEDPRETVNLAEEHPERVRRLAAMLSDWLGSDATIEEGDREVVPDERTMERLRALGYAD